MEPQAFVAEVYRRMQLIAGERHVPLISLEEYLAQNPWLPEYYRVNLGAILPRDKEARILDIGSGDGQFAAAALAWGYRNVSVADFGAEHFAKVASWGAVRTLEVEKDIPVFLAQLQGEFDFVHASHLIEHIPKHDLLENVDAMFYALKPGGRLVLVTPNMLSPVAMWSLFVTLGHEYGFSSDNLKSLLSICGFVSIEVNDVRLPSSRLRWKASRLVRTFVGGTARIRNRLYGVTNVHSAASILVSATRPDEDPLSFRSALPSQSPEVV